MCFLLASAIIVFCSSILSSGSEVDPGDAVVVGGPVAVSPPVEVSPPGVGVGPVGAGVASHSSAMVAAPDETALKQYSLVSGASSLGCHCQWGLKM